MPARILRAIPLLSTLLAALLLSGCISTSGIEAVSAPERMYVIAAADTQLERGRQAILSMVGDYEVTFSFTETEALQPGYQLRDTKDSTAYELVLVAEESDTRIVLQHLLVHRAAGFVIKHWRQDWVYEAPARLEFTQDQTWQLRDIPAAVTGNAWTQCVYEVSDAPRYCGTGKWEMSEGVATWTSDAGYRPLPRREYTSRSDYNVLGVINTHSIVMDGWTHGQLNTKLVREGTQVVERIAQERGMNTYRRITGYNFSSGYEYWDKTAAYWQRIRQQWADRVQRHGGVHLVYPVDGMKMIMDMYWQSERARKGREVSDQDIIDLFEPWVLPPAGSGAG